MFYRSNNQPVNTWVKNTLYEQTFTKSMANVAEYRATKLLSIMLNLLLMFIMKRDIAKP